MISGKLLFAINNFNNLAANLENQIIKNWLTKIINMINNFICYLLGIIQKFNSKLCRIHYFIYFDSYLSTVTFSQMCCS